jgi:hypothetical protein
MLHQQNFMVPANPHNLIIQKTTEDEEILRKTCILKKGNQVLINWIPPDAQDIKINVDGASSGNPGPAGAGGLLRDFTGKWLKGFVINVGVATNTTAEFWGILKGLELAWELGFRSLLLESNSQNCLHLIKHATTQDPHFNLILNVRRLMDRQ